MSKKMYMKPEMKAVYFQHQPQLVVASATGEGMHWNPGGIPTSDEDR